MESIWQANKPHWVDRARCGGADPGLFQPLIETDDGLERVKERYCNGCPVLDRCLNSAIIHGDTGFWGGTNSVQRRAIRRTRSRSKCPVCSSKDLVRVPHGKEEAVTWFEVCVSCAASWKADDRPTPRQKEAEKSLTAQRVKRRPGNTAVTTVPLTEGAASCL
jgi:Transcription factor WhiB